MLINTETEALQALQAWATFKETEASCGLELLAEHLIPEPDPVTEPPRYRLVNGHVKPELELLRAETFLTNLSLVVRCEGRKTKKIFVQLSDDGTLTNFGQWMLQHSDRDDRAQIDASRLDPISDAATTSIIKEYLNYVHAVQKRVHALNSERLTAYNHAKTPVKMDTIDQGIKREVQATDGASTSSADSESIILSVQSRRAKRRRIDDGDANVGSFEYLDKAIAPFFQTTGELLGAAQEAFNLYSTLNLPDESVKAATKRLGEAIDNLRKEKTAPAVQQSDDCKKSKGIKRK
ncbi:hypothetical protein HDK64DRAFT_297010 [Phyllosticta capitalensis]